MGASFEELDYCPTPIGATHVVFYREETFHHLANRSGWFCETPVKDVALMRRPAGAGAA